MGVIAHFLRNRLKLKTLDAFQQVNSRDNFVCDFGSASLPSYEEACQLPVPEYRRHKASKRQGRLEKPYKPIVDRDPLERMDRAFDAAIYSAHAIL